MTTELQELYRTIGRQHCRLGQSYITLADLLLEEQTIGPERSVEAVAAVVGGVNPEPESSTVPTEVRPPEMAVHVPSTVPPQEHPLYELVDRAIALTKACAPPPDVVSDDVPPPVTLYCDTSGCNLLDNHDGPCPNSNTVAPLSNIGGRKKTDMTAAQWGNGLQFTKYVMRTEPFKSWTAEQQNAKRDEFVAKQPPDEIMNRWGQRFAKFCGVA